jgi:hypothetical protein
MSNLLVAMILSVCPPSIDGGTNECHEWINNCAVELHTLITEKSIKECLREYESRGRRTKSSDLED